MDEEYKREDLLTENLDGYKCKIYTPLHLKCPRVQYGNEKVGIEYLIVVSDDPYCWGTVDARTLYEELKKRYEA